jgi:hypothetical protein
VNPEGEAGVIATKGIWRATRAAARMHSAPTFGTGMPADPGRLGEGTIASRERPRIEGGHSHGPATAVCPDYGNAISSYGR